MTERAAKLYPYQYPGDGESDLIKQYGTAEDLKDWESIISQCDDLISRKEMIPDINLVRLADIQTRAERRFYEETLRGDYELFKELVSMTVNDYSPETAVYHFTDAENAKYPEYLRFSFSLWAHCLILLRAESYYGWDKIKDEKGRKYTHAAINDRTAELFPEAKDALQKDLEQLAALDGSSSDQSAAATDKPPSKRKRQRAQIHIDTLPSQLIATLDPVSYQAMEGLLEGSDYAGALQPVYMFTPKYKKKDGRHAAGKPVNVFAILECKGAELSQPLDMIDGAILRAIYSLLDAGESRFTISHIWELIAGDGQRTNQSRIEDIIIRVRRMIGTTARISYQEYAKAKSIEYTDDITAQILPGVTLHVRKNKNGEVIGADLKCNQPLEAFPFYQFAAITEQITTIPIEAATVRGLTVNDKPQQLTDSRLTIREMLLRRIAKQHRNKSDQVILFATIYEKVNATDTKQQLRARDAVENFLYDWVQLGTVYAFAFRKKGKTIDAVLIANSKEETDNFPGVQWSVKG